MSVRFTLNGRAVEATDAGPLRPPTTRRFGRSPRAKGLTFRTCVTRQARDIARMGIVARVWWRSRVNAPWLHPASASPPKG